MKDRREGLEALAAPLRDQGIRVSAAVLSGTPFLELIRQVLRRKHDLVILTAEGRGGLKERLCRTGIPGFLIGNTAESVLQQVDTSVLTVKPERFVTPVTV